MDVQQPYCAENSIKICSLCYDTIFRLQASTQCASVAAVTRGAAFLAAAVRSSVQALASATFLQSLRNIL